ncbi:MAG: hypothetical protein ABR586_10785 [Thermoplasmatota archaeon]
MAIPRQRPFWGSLMASAVRNGPLLVVLVPAILYLAGSLYLHAYYVRLGIPGSELHFELPEVLQASQRVLQAPVLWLVILASACLLTAHLMGRVPRSLFDPIPTAQAVAAVFLVWAIKVTADVVQPAASVDWLLGRRRDLLFAGAGVLLLVGLYVGYSREAVPRRARCVLDPATRSILLFLLFMGLYVVLQAVLVRRWPYSWVATAVLGVGLLFLTHGVLRQVLAWTRRGRWQPAPAKPAREVGAPATNPGLSLFVSVLAVLSVLLVSALSGTAVGKAVSTVCVASRAVSFDPSPPRIDRNHTYFLTRHDNEHYYLRENATGKVVIVPDNPGVVVTLSWARWPITC